MAVRRIRAEHPDVAVLVLSQYVEASYAMLLLEEHPEGVAYLLKQRGTNRSSSGAADRAVSVDLSLGRIGFRPRFVSPVWCC